MRQKTVVATLALGGCLLCTAAANASTVELGYSTGSTIIVVGSGTNQIGGVTFDGTAPGFSSISITGTGTPPLPAPSLLDTSTIDVSASPSPTAIDKINIFVTETGLTSPIGALNFASGLALNSDSSPGVMVLEQTFLDSSNTAFGTADPLSSAAYTGNTNLQANTFYAAGVTGSGPYSVTAEYTLTMFPGEQADGTIDISAMATPLPGALPLLASGLGLLAFTTWKGRRKKMARSVLDSAAV